jgi:HTH-type transcriptional regulator / antitoxin HigA
MEAAMQIRQPRDLIPFIGGRNRVHEVLNRRRPLTLKMIWRLHEGLGIPAESLIKVGRGADSLRAAARRR